MITVMNEELKKIVEWMHVNKLCLNTKINQYMIFSRNRIFPSIEKIYINGESIELVSSFKFLGVILDLKLKWNDHIQLIKGKVAKGLGIVYKAKKVLQQSTLLTLYYSFIYPYITYCIELWGDAYDNCLSPLFKLNRGP